MRSELNIKSQIKEIDKVLAKPKDSFIVVGYATYPNLRDALTLEKRTLEWALEGGLDNGK